MSRAPAAVHILVTLGLATAVVATPLMINFAAFALWVIIVARWVKRRTRASGRRAGAAELVVHLVTMSVLVLAAASAPGKVVDQVKARHVAVPRQEMTIDELQEPETFGLARPFPYWISASDDLADRVVRFPALELTVGEFIAAIEEQTPLRHGFGHCGNGTTILWGGDCSFGLSFREPPR
jgi:hypothetical protein